ncbi:hypothetical protein ACFU8X_26445 [Brevibacillus porteri]|uniref:hypothetical protein n=1 Tax=Brevibacillus porteri TaxID=2126350 RepID=UPI00370A6FCC
MLENRLNDQGVTSKAMVRSITQQGLKFAVSSGMLAEATYDPVPVFTQLKLPVLAIALTVTSDEQLTLYVTTAFIITIEENLDGRG